MDSIDQRALTVEQIKRLILGAFEVPMTGGELTEPCTPEELFLSTKIEVSSLCRLALDELIAEGKVEKTERKALNGAPFYRRV